MNTPEIEIPEIPQLIQQPNGFWRVRLPDEFIRGKRTACWLSGPELRDGEWVWTSQGAADTAAREWWTDRLGAQFRAIVVKQADEVEPWFVADRRAGFKFHD